MNKDGPADTVDKGGEKDPPVAFESLLREMKKAGLNIPLGTNAGPSR